VGAGAGSISAQAESLSFGEHPDYTCGAGFVVEGDGQSCGGPDKAGTMIAGRGDPTCAAISKFRRCKNPFLSADIFNYKYITNILLLVVVVVLLVVVLLVLLVLVVVVVIAYKLTPYRFDSPLARTKTSLYPYQHSWSSLWKNISFKFCSNMIQYV
jgi:hypothetical protein